MTVIVGGRTCDRGIDVSRWQGSIDWQAVARARAFAWIKASGGDGGVYPDGRYLENRAKAAATTIPTGAYHFLGAHVDGRAQARQFLATTSGYTGHALPPVVDVEHAGTPAATVNAFLDELGRGLARRWPGPTGRPVAAVVYTGAPMANMVDPAWGVMDLWLAAYLSPTYPRPGPDVTALGTPDRYVPRRAWAGWSIWQWAGEDGRCPGVPGACDQNVATVEWLTRTLGATPAPPPPPPEDPMPDDVTLARLDSIDKRIDELPDTLAGFEQDTRRYEGLAPLKLPEGPEQYMVVMVDGRPHRHHLTEAEKALLQLSGQLQTVWIPTGDIGADGKPVMIDFIPVTGAAADALRALPEV